MNYFAYLTALQVPQDLARVNFLAGRKLLGSLTD